MNLWVAAVATVICMALQDVGATLLVVSESRNLRWWPGVFDAVGDWVSRAGGAVTAGAYVKYGLFNWHTQLLLGLTMLTSLTVTNTATPLAHKLLPKAREAED